MKTFNNWLSEIAVPYEGDSVPGESPIHGKRKEAAKKIVNELIAKPSQTFYHDSAWAGVDEVWNKLRAANIDYTMTGNRYTKDDMTSQPTGKIYTFEVNFINNKGRPDKMYGVITASFAGSVQDPSEKYDIVAYVS